MSAEETQLSSIAAPVRRPRRDPLRVPIDDIPRGSLVDMESSVEIDMSGDAQSDDESSLEADAFLESTSSIPPANGPSPGSIAPPDIEVSLSIAPPHVSIVPPKPGSIPPPPPGSSGRSSFSIPPPPPPPTGISVPPPRSSVEGLPTAKSEEISLAPSQLLELASAIDRGSDDHDVEEMDAADFEEDSRVADAPAAEAPKPKPAPAAAPPTPPAAPPPAPPSPPTGALPPAVPAVPRKKPDWFDSFFNEDYLRTVRQPTAKSIARQCEFIEKVLGVAAGSQILDVGCGLGYHANELARRGHHLVGLDASKTMLTRATEDASDYGVEVRYLQGDMREMSFDIAFDAVLCWGTTFGYFDEETNRRVLLRLRDSLREGGKLLLDVVNRDFVVRSQPNLVWFEGDGCVCMEETQFNAATSTLEVSRNVMLDEGRQRETSYTVRLYALHELMRELDAIGFKVLSVSGSTSTPGVFFGADAPRIILLAERKSSTSKSSPAAAPSSPSPVGG